MKQEGSSFPAGSGGRVRHLSPNSYNKVEGGSNKVEKLSKFSSKSGKQGGRWDRNDSTAEENFPLPNISIGETNRRKSETPLLISP